MWELCWLLVFAGPVAYTPVLTVVVGSVEERVGGVLDCTSPSLAEALV